MNAVLYFGTGLLSLANGFLIFFVNPARAINRVFFFASAWIALWFFCVFMAMQEGAHYISGPAHAVLFWVRLSSAVAAFLVWHIWLMRSALLSRDADIGTIFRRSWLWFWISCLIAAFTFRENFVPPDSSPLMPKYGPGYYFYSLIIGGCCLFLLVDTLRHMRHLTGASKIQMQFFVFNTVCVCLLLVLIHLFGRLFNLRWPRLLSPIAFSVVHALSFWAICSYRIFDAKQLVLSIAQRVFFFAILGAGTFLAARILSRVISAPFDILFSVLLAGLLAMACERLMLRWLNLEPERLLLKPRRQLIERSRLESDTGKVKHYFSQFLADWCQTDRVDLLSIVGGTYTNARLTLSSDWAGLPYLCKCGWLTPESLQRKRVEPGSESCAELMAREGFGALLAVPRSMDAPSLLIALGRKISLRPYTYPDIRHLIDLTELMDNILAHATLSQHASKLSQMESAMMISRSLAHDLGNLTTPIASFLLYTEGRAALGSAEAAVHEAASHSVKVMNEYIRESLFYSRRLTPNRKALDPREVLATVSKLTQERATQRGIRLQFHCDMQGRFQVDPILFSRLATNLVNNAVDAADHATQVMILLSQSSGVALLTVINQGAAIPNENLKRIFDPYFTTKNTGNIVRGLGLGLAICRKIADLHGGQIEVDSRNGRTAFVATFPQPVDIQGPAFSASAATAPALSSPLPLQPHLA